MTRSSEKQYEALELKSIESPDDKLKALDRSGTASEIIELKSGFVDFVYKLDSP